MVFNMKELMKDNDNELSPAAGLKVLSMFIVIYGHRYLLNIYGPVVNMVDIEKVRMSCLRFWKFNYTCLPLLHT